MTLERLLLLLLSLTFSFIAFSLLTIIKRFIESKPPGRRLVTSDVHILQVYWWMYKKIGGVAALVTDYPCANLFANSLITLP